METVANGAILSTDEASVAISKARRLQRSKSVGTS